LNCTWPGVGRRIMIRGRDGCGRGFRCFLATLRVSRGHLAGCLSDHFCLFIDHGDPFTSSGLLHSGAYLRACFGWFEKDAPSLTSNSPFLEKVTRYRFQTTVEDYPITSVCRLKTIFWHLLNTANPVQGRNTAIPSGTKRHGPGVKMRRPTRSLRDGCKPMAKSPSRSNP
jgi:hypothetical protein